MNGHKKATPAILKQMKAAPKEKGQAPETREDCCKSKKGKRPAVVTFNRALNGIIAQAYHPCGILILEVNVYRRVGFKFGAKVAGGSAGGCKPLVAVGVHFRRTPGQKYYVAYTVADCCRRKKNTFYLAI